MRRNLGIALAAAAFLFVAGADLAQAQDESRAVADGGIFVEGWKGRIDPQEAARGFTLSSARLSSTADGALQVTTGPAVTYWNPANVATGNYTVKATFTEPEYMSLNNHPHPYGIVIAGSDMDTDKPRYLYCAAYGNGRFIVRGFGPEPFQLNGRRGEEHEAVNRAAGPGESVTQEIAVTVRDGKVECAINGTVVASYDRSEVIGEGRLPSTDGVYGIRFGHNTEGIVTGLTVIKH